MGLATVQRAAKRTAGRPLPPCHASSHSPALDRAAAGWDSRREVETLALSQLATWTRELTARERRLDGQGRCADLPATLLLLLLPKRAREPMPLPIAEAMAAAAQRVCPRVEYVCLDTALDRSAKGRELSN